MKAMIHAMKFVEHAYFLFRYHSFFRHLSALLRVETVDHDGVATASKW